MVAAQDLKHQEHGREGTVRRIVVVDEVADIADTIRYNLEHQGFQVQLAITSQMALNLILAHPPNLVLLNINLPEMSGYELCRRLRAEATTATVPILMLGANLRESDKIFGSEVGVDEYLTKPFRMRQLLARVNAILRRTDGPDEPIYDDGVLVIDPWAFMVRYEGRDVRLTRKEMRLLEELARNKGRVMLREVLLDRIWGLQDFGDSRTLDVHIRKLRMKLGNPNLIETVKGVGYRLLGAQA